MIDDETLNKEQKYGALALAYCQTQQAGVKHKLIFPTIEPGKPEWQAWERYFKDRLGFEPWAMKAVRTERIKAMTVPAQWPEWFDSSFAGVTGTYGKRRAGE